MGTGGGVEKLMRTWRWTSLERGEGRGGKGRGDDDGKKVGSERERRKGGRIL